MARGPRLNVNLIFDGIVQSGGSKSDFNKAIKLVSAGKYRANLADRAKMLDQKKLSNFFAGGEGPKRFPPAIRGFLGEPKNQSAYANPSSVPDTEISIKDLELLVGKEFASQFEASDVTRQGFRTIEIKQQADPKAKTSKTTFTGLSPGRDTEEGKRLFDISGEKQVTTKDGKPIFNKDGTPKLTNITLNNTDDLWKWFESKSQTNFRNRAIQQFEQKMANYLLITTIDGKASVQAAPGLAKAFNLQNKQNRRKYLFLEFRRGTVALRATTVAERFIKSKLVDISTKVAQATADNFAQNLLEYYVRGDGASALKKAGASTKYGFVNAFAELLLIIKEFDESAGRPFILEIGSKSQSGPGIIAAGTRAKTRKRQLQPREDLQAQVSLAQIEALARRLFREKMPTGVPGGPPPPRPDVLTFRTGRLVDSFRVIQYNQKKNIIKYTFDPIYNVYDGTQRDVDELIVQSGLRPAVRQLIGEFHRYLNPNNRRQQGG
jgi:hypothetical protein